MGGKALPGHDPESGNPSVCKRKYLRGKGVALGQQKFPVLASEEKAPVRRGRGFNLKIEKEDKGDGM